MHWLCSRIITFVARLHALRIIRPAALHMRERTGLYYLVYTLETRSLCTIIVRSDPAACLP